MSDNDDSKEEKTQLTREDLQQMSATEIMAAHRQGRTRDLLHGTS